MGQWDSAAAARLDTVTGRLRDDGVVDVARRLTRRVWRSNLERYEPSELGDTAAWLGMGSAINLGQLLARHYADVGDGDGRAVSASWPQGSLLLSAGQVRVQVMKAPPSPLRTPAWEGFAWAAADSQSRHLAAQRNTAAYGPAASDQDGRPPMLEDGDAPLWDSGEDPGRLLDVTLVWSGESEQGLTAGWLGLPSLGCPPWFAVAPLWWDEEDETGGVRTPLPGTPDGGDDFAARPQPRLALGLRDQRRVPAAPDRL